MNAYYDQFNDHARKISNYLPDMGTSTLVAIGFATIGGICLTASLTMSIKIGLLAATVNLINSIAKKCLQNRSLNLIESSVKNTIIILISHSIFSVSSIALFPSIFLINFAVNAALQFLYGSSSENPSTSILYLGCTFIEFNYKTFLTSKP